MSTQISKTIASCFAAVWQICSIQRSVSRRFCCLSSRHSCCHAWIIGNLACGHSQIHVPAGLLILHACCITYDHVSPLFQRSHWLSVRPQCIKYQLAVLMFRCRHNMAPEYTWQESSSGPLTLRLRSSAAKYRLFALSTIALLESGNLPPTVASISTVISQ